MARTELVGEDKDDFDRLEGVIQKGLETFVDVGKALLEIKERRLYLAVSSTYEAYVQIRWKMSRAYADRQIKAAETVVLLESAPIGAVPESEAVARPLTTLPAEQQAEAWQEAVEESGGQPTAKDVQRVVDRRRDLPKVPRPPKAPKPETPEDTAAAIVASTADTEAVADTAAPPTAASVQRHFRRPVDSRVRALVSAAHEMSTLDDEEVSALETNDLMIEGLRKAQAQIERIIEAHTHNGRRSA